MNTDGMYANQANLMRGAGIVGADTLTDTPDLHRIAVRLENLIEQMASVTQRMDGNLDRLGRSRAFPPSETCSPCRAGVIGSIEDKLDTLGVLAGTAEDIARSYDRIA